MNLGKGAKAAVYDLATKTSCVCIARRLTASPVQNLAGRLHIISACSTDQKQKKAFPKNLGDISTKKFYKAVNKIEPNLIRTEADELHYHFHVLIRFEIEKGLMEGKLKVGNLDEVWNAKYKEYLGVKVPDAKHGMSHRADAFSQLVAAVFEK